MPELFVEPPGAGVPRRAGTALLNTQSSESSPVRPRELAPPSAPVPARAGLADVPLAPAALGVAALVLGVASRGDIVVLAVLLAAAGSSRVRALAIALACTAPLVRWGSSSLGAIAGAQAVLGPAGWTGDGPGVASAWLAALALLACVPAWPMRVDDQKARRMVVVFAVAPFAIAAADVTVGPAPGGVLPARVVASLVATVVGVVVARATVRPRHDRARVLMAVVAGAAAVVLAGASG